MRNRTDKLVYWTSRILAIAFICFLALFSLDVFEPGAGIGQIAVGLFMHNIPVFILAFVLWVSWRREIVGGIVFTLIGSLFVFRAVLTMSMNGFEWSGLWGTLPLAAPALLIGALFMMGRSGGVRRDGRHLPDRGENRTA